MNVKEQLIAAKALIATREAWTQGTSARDSLGHAVDPRSPDATCWCAMGAIEKATGEYCKNGRGAYGALLHTGGFASVIGVSGVNDDLGFDAVHELFDAAIAAQDEVSK